MRTMTTDEPLHPIALIIWGALALASAVHVFTDSRRGRRIGHPWAHALMCLIVLWPFVYLLWLFWWPGKVRQAIFGSDKLWARRWAERKLKAAALNQAPHDTGCARS